MSSSALAAGLRRLRGQLAARQGSEDSDEQLLHAITARRDEAAFAVLVRRHGPMVLHVCRRVLGHEQDAEDAFQATFLVLAQNAAALRSKMTLASFLHGIAYRTAMKAKRSSARRRKHERSLGARTQPRSPVEELSWREVRALLDEEIDRLPEIYRSVFVLCSLEEVSREEAARRLGLKEGTVSSRLTGARKRLSQRLARRGVELTAVLAASALATPSVSALSPLLIATTIKAALAMDEGVAGIVSASVAELVRSAASAALLSKAKILSAVLLIVSVLAGVGAWAVSASRWKPNTETPLPQANARSHMERGNEEPARQPEKEEVVRVNGRVLGPDGRPVAGARLYSARLRTLWPLGGAMVAPAQQRPTEADGRFRIALNRPGYDDYCYLIAHVPGFGVDWIDLSVEERLKKERLEDVTFRVVKDVPITGRVVNTEGRPVAGVSVSPVAVWAPENEKLDDFLNGWHSTLSMGYTTPLDALNSPRKHLYAPLDAISGAPTTDKDGRFTLRGVGGERIVQVAIFGGGVARSTLYVITRPDFEAAPYAVLQKDEAARKFAASDRFLGLHSPTFTFVAEAGKTIEGVVKDANSGKPLPGVRLGCRDSVVVFSDAAGAYRMNGLPKRAEGYAVWVIPPEGSSYLSRSAHADDTVGFTKVRLDIKLVKGAIVAGRVVDRRTGKPLRCGLWCAPLPGNKFYDSKPGFKSDNSDEALEMDKDGRFRLTTIPGKALLLARVTESDLRFQGRSVSEYRRAVPDPDHKDLFLKINGDTWSIMTVYREEWLSGYNAVKVIDIKENSETRVELSVDAGATARIAVQDADGKPLAGAWAEGLTDLWPNTFKLPEATATVYALNPEKPRTLAFYHPVKKLGGSATVRGDEKEPIVVKLAPLGKVAGRLRDGDGNSLEGVEVSIDALDQIGGELYRFAAPTGKPVRTDKDGRFRIEGVVPGLKFGLGLRRQNTSFVGEPRIGLRQVKPGEALDLGEMRVKPAQ